MKLIIDHTPTFCKIRDLVPRDLGNEISDYLSYQVPNYEYTEAGMSGYWDGKKRLYKLLDQTFPSGLLYMVEEVLQREGVDYEISNFVVPDIKGWYDFENGNLRDYQLESVLKAVEAGRGVVWLPTGSGKSHVLVGLMSIIGRKGLIVVHRKELMDQMIGHLEKAGFAVGKIQGGKSLDAAAYKGFPKDVYVGMAATLCTAHKKLSASFTKLTEVIEVIAIDEVQRSGAEKYYNMIMAFDAPYRFGTSATIKGRSDGADLMLHALTGDVVAHVSERELMDDEWLSEPRIYILPVKSDHSNMYDWAEIYSEAIVNNKERNGLIADAFMDLFKAGKSILVICNYIEHGKLLQEAINDRMLSWANETDQSFPAVDFVHGSTPKMIREAKVNAIRRGDIQGIIMSSISDEGLDLPDLDAVIVAAAGKSPIKALQRLGRGIRKKESGECWFFDFVDQDGGMLEDHSDSRLRAYESRDFEVNVCSYREFLNDLNESSGVD